MSHTIRKAFEYYMSAAKIKPVTVSGCRNVLRQLENAGIADMELYKVTPAILREFVQNLKGIESTVYNRYIQFKVAFKFYVKEHNLPIRYDHLNIMKVPRKKTADDDDGVPEYFTLDEVKSLAEREVPERLAYARDLFLVMCYTGMAISDILKFNPESNLHEDGKWLKYRRTKNNNLCKIPLIPLVKPLIARLRWPARIVTRTLQTHLQHLSEITGLEIHSHKGRHSFGCIMLEIGLSMDTVSAMMGHSSIQTTQRFYAKVSQAKIEKEFGALSERAIAEITLPQMDKQCNVVYNTDDYDKFSFFEENRDVNRPHVEEIKESMKKKCLDKPIDVNENFGIVDGQHTFTARRELKLPILYIIHKGWGVDDIPILNTNQKNWLAGDFLHLYLSQGLKHYEVYKNFDEHWGFTHQVNLMLLTDEKDGRPGEKFEKGLFKATKLNWANEFAPKIHALGEFYNGYKRRAFISAFIKLSKMPGFKDEQLLAKLRYQSRKLVDCTSVDEYFSLLREIYNYKTRNNETKI